MCPAGARVSWWSPRLVGGVKPDLKPFGPHYQEVDLQEYASEMARFGIFLFFWRVLVTISAEESAEGLDEEVPAGQEDHHREQNQESGPIHVELHRDRVWDSVSTFLVTLLIRSQKPRGGFCVQVNGEMPVFHRLFGIGSRQHPTRRDTRAIPGLSFN